MLDADLSSLVLDLAAWGVCDASTLAWLDPPPKPAWNEAVKQLRDMGALDEAGRLTAHGEALARLPLSPRLAHMVAAAAAPDRLLAAMMAVLTTEQGLGGRDINIAHRVDALLHDRSERARAARALARRIAGEGESAVDSSRAGPVLARGFPDRIAKARGVTQSGQRQVSFLMANGRAAAVNDDDALAREAFLVIADSTGAPDRARILAAAPIAQSEIEQLFADRIETHAAMKVDQTSGAVRGRRIRRLGRVTLSEAPLDKLDRAEMADALLEAVQEQGLDLLEWDAAATQARARIAFLHGLDGEPWPDWRAETLMDTLDAWLKPALEGQTRLKAVDVASALLNTLPYDMRRQLDHEAPAQFETPAGSSLTIDYEAAGGPALNVRLQELFGLDKHPSVAGGRAPLTLRLLSPAHRPVQTTKDLPGFWRGSYAAVRADMRGRYPKHPWPDDPLNAPPTRRAKPRGS